MVDVERAGIGRLAAIEARHPSTADDAAASLGADGVDRLAEEIDLIQIAGTEADFDAVARGEASPVCFGSALTNFGVDVFLERFLSLAPPPTPRESTEGIVEPAEHPFSGFVFKVQANMDRSHRDRIAFVRICSGRFERGMVLTCDRTEKPFATKYASTVFGAERTTIEGTA